MMHRVEGIIGSGTLSFETGKFAQQANAAVTVTYGDTVVMITACDNKSPYQKYDFLPLTVDYEERLYAAGKIPGGFCKREGRPSEREILTSRIIDRPIRPLFPSGYNYETQIIASVLSIDSENDPDIMALTGASCALSISDIPFAGPIAAVRVGRIDNKFTINPVGEELEKSDMDMVVAGSRDSIVMVEGKFSEIDESVVLDAIFTAHRALQPLIDLQLELVKEVGLEKRKFETRTFSQELFSDAEKKNKDKINHSEK